MEPGLRITPCGMMHGYSNGPPSCSFSTVLPDTFQTQICIFSVDLNPLHLFRRKPPPSFCRAYFALFFASNMVKTRCTRTRAQRMTAPSEDSITRAQDERRDATESQAETQPHTARRSARNTARPQLPAPSRVGAATEVHVPNSAQRLSDEDRRTDALAEIADPQSAQIEASAPNQPPVRRSSRVRTRAAAAGTRNIAAGQDNTNIITKNLFESFIDMVL